MCQVIKFFFSLFGLFTSFSLLYVYFFFSFSFLYSFFFLFPFIIFLFLSISPISYIWSAIFWKHHSHALALFASLGISIIIVWDRKYHKQYFKMCWVQLYKLINYLGCSGDGRMCAFWLSLKRIFIVTREGCWKQNKNNNN